jgi:hypothetical protein
MPASPYMPRLLKEGRLPPLSTQHLEETGDINLRAC